MTKNEIKMYIRKRINNLGVIGAYEDMVIANAKCINEQFKHIPNTLEKQAMIINTAHSFTVDAIKSAGMTSLFRKTVFTYDDMDNVINDPIYDNLVPKILKAIKED